MPKNILICVTGLTPQIVTETLFCLALQRKTPIDEIYVLTTSRGREVILGQDKAAHTPKTSLFSEIKSLCGTFKIRVPLFIETDAHIITAKEESVEFNDVRSDKQNVLFPNKVAEVIREKSSDPECVLHCCISGGRKSMSVHLAFALGLFGRFNDKLYHILTKEENEFKGFYPANKKAGRDLELSEIPFVRLRALVSNDLIDTKIFEKSYFDIVNDAQNKVQILTNTTKLFIDIAKREIRFGSKSARFEPQEFGIYFWFVDRALTNQNALSIYELSEKSVALEISEIISGYFKAYYAPDEKTSWRKAGFQAEALRQKFSKINKKILELDKDRELLKQFCISPNKLYRSTTYSIQAKPEKFSIKYND